MTTAVLVERDDTTAVATAWRHFQRPRPHLNGFGPAELLACTARLPGVLRYGLVGNEVMLLGELRLPRDANIEEIIAQLEGLSQSSRDERTQSILAEEVVNATLEETGLGWKRRDSGWALPAGGSLPREIHLTPNGDGLHLEAILLEWDEAVEAEFQALAHLLCRAQLGLRFARCRLQPGQAAVEADIDTRHLAEALADGIGGVAAGARLLAREVAALLEPAAARAFLDFLVTAEKVSPART
jgi:hypothetical protein